MAIQFHKNLPLGLTNEMHDSLSKAAVKAGTTMSDYVREAVASQLVKDGFNQPSLGRTSEQRERESVMLALPEARGRRSLATHLAVNTTFSIEESKRILTKASFDEAEAMATDAVARYRTLKG